LDALVTRRGEIAHRVVSSKPVFKRDVENAVELVRRLAVCLSNAVRKFLLTRVPFKEAWPEYDINASD